jgi:hypothetical protein
MRRGARKTPRAANEEAMNKLSLLVTDDMVEAACAAAWGSWPLMLRDHDLALTEVPACRLQIRAALEAALAQQALSADAVAQAFREQSPEHERLYVEAESRALTQQAQERALIEVMREGEHVTAVLAQQAQPLTDDEIEAQSRERYAADTVSSRLDYRDGAMWARDRMAALAASGTAPESEDDCLADRVHDFVRYAKRRMAFVHDRADHMEVYSAEDIDNYFKPELEAAATETRI